MYIHDVKTTRAGLADFIREWLRERDTTQLWLAQQAGIPHSVISALFTRGAMPRPGTLRKLAKPLGIPLGRLLVIAGYISEEEYETPIQEADLARLYEIGDLTDEEWEQVLEFGRYVRSRRKK